jgi:hypothetical protein
MAKASLDENILARRFDEFLDRKLDTQGALQIFGDVVEKEHDPDIWTLRPNARNLPGVREVRFFPEELGGKADAVETIELDLDGALKVKRAALEKAFGGELRALPPGPSPRLPRVLTIHRAESPTRLDGGAQFTLEPGAKKDADPLPIVKVQFDRDL